MQLTLGDDKSQERLLQQIPVTLFQLVIIVLNNSKTVLVITQRTEYSTIYYEWNIPTKADNWTE